MRNPFVSRSLALLMAMAIAAAGCQQTSRITTEPEGARISINGVDVGDSPAIYRYRSGLPATYYVRISKPGYQEVKDITIDRVYRADVSLLLLLAGIIPYFFSARLEDQYVFPMRPIGEAANP